MLSELFNTKNGYTPSKSKPEFWANGTIPWFRMEDIRENGRILSKATQYVSKDAIKGSPFPENSIIVATSATIGEHALAAHLALYAGGITSCIFRGLSVGNTLPGSPFTAVLRGLRAGGAVPLAGAPLFV